MTLRLIFTLDYEMFGDGSGSSVREQVVPTAHLANVLELYGHRLTLFVEVGQQIYFRANGMEQHYAPVERQLRDLYARGHGVELHIHPMWFLAGPPVGGKVPLDSDAYDLSLLDPVQVDEIIARSCAYLREVIAPLDAAYRPRAYRAGAWSMQQHAVLFESLARHGIEIDSTIAPGAKFAAAYGRFDYRKYVMRPYWQEGPLLELPILTERRPLAALAHNNRQGRLVRRIFNRFYCSRLSLQGRSRLGRLYDMAARDYVMADFNMLEPRQLVAMILRYRRAYPEVEALPVVLIGHSKTTYYTDNLHELFAGLQRAGIEVLPGTLADVIAEKSEQVHS